MNKSFKSLISLFWGFLLLIQRLRGMNLFCTFQITLLIRLGKRDIFHKIFKYHGGREKLEIARVNITKSYSANIENTKTEKCTTTKIYRIGSLIHAHFFTRYITTRYFMFTHYTQRPNLTFWFKTSSHLPQAQLDFWCFDYLFLGIVFFAKCLARSCFANCKTDFTFWGLDYLESPLISQLLHWPASAVW